MPDEIKELAIPGFHRWVNRFILNRFGENFTGATLDAGAGHGALTQKLKDFGYPVSACDLYPELFQVEGVEFRQADISKEIPWRDASFDLVIALEVTEHIDSISAFFHEVSRVLKPGGYFLFSTPNILSLKSRIQFLLSGFFYSFEPFTERQSNEISQHITPLPYHLYEFRLVQCGMRVEEVTTDKRQKSSKGWMALYPLIKLLTRVKYKEYDVAKKQNCPDLLCGRKLVVLARKM